MADKLLYFNIRARGEAVRMMYAVANKEIDETTVPFGSDEFKQMQPDLPMGQLPTFTTPDGTIFHSNVIARHVGKKLGLAGENGWEESMHDLVLECAHECLNVYAMPGIYTWLVVKAKPTPENSEEIIQKAREKWIKTLNYIQTIAEKRGKKYIIGDELGLAELWLYAALEFCKAGSPDIMTVTPWTKSFTEKVAADPKLKKHFAERPDSLV